MIIVLVLTATLALVIFYGVRLVAATQPVVGGLVALTAGLGILLVWNPDLATRIANLLGVGRGTDLLVYILFVLMAMLVLLIHARFRSYDRVLTELARSVALTGAQTPPGLDEPGPAGRPAGQG